MPPNCMKSPAGATATFGINEAGHVCVLPNKDATKPIDLKQLVDRLQLRGIDSADPDPLRRDS